MSQNLIERDKIARRLNRFEIESDGNVFDSVSGLRFELTCVHVLVIHYLKLGVAPSELFDLVDASCHDDHLDVGQTFITFISQLAELNIV